MFGSEYKKQNYRRKGKEPSANVGQERIEAHARRLRNKGRVHRERFDEQAAAGGKHSVEVIPEQGSVSSSSTRTTSQTHNSNSKSARPDEAIREILPEGVGEILNIVA
ncbi:MAG: hypothetical protein KDD53_04605 [Bdellovibrionales bacterium]|nr:hypothetical protein [Bdellovibrionales bacterium]